MEDPVEEKCPLVSRVTVLKHMFTLQELKEVPSLLLELKEDVREEAENLGDATNVVLSRQLEVTIPGWNSYLQPSCYDVSSNLSSVGCAADVPAAGARGGDDSQVSVRVLPSALGKEVILNDECAAENAWAIFCWTED